MTDTTETPVRGTPVRTGAAIDGARVAVQPEPVSPVHTPTGTPTQIISTAVQPDAPVRVPDEATVELVPPSQGMQWLITGAIIVLSVIATGLAAVGQQVGASKTSGGAWESYVIPAIFELPVVALIGLGWWRGRDGHSPFGLWGLACGWGGYGTYMQLTHDGALAQYYAAASVMTLILWFAKLTMDVKKALSNADARGVGLLWLQNPRLAARTWLVRHQVRPGGKPVTTSTIISWAQLWIDIYDAALKAGYEKNDAQRTAWRFVRCTAGLPVADLPKVTIEKVEIEPAAQDVPAQDVPAQAPPAHRTGTTRTGTTGAGTPARSVRTGTAGPGTPVRQARTGTPEVGTPTAGTPAQAVRTADAVPAPRTGTREPRPEPNTIAFQDEIVRLNEKFSGWAGRLLRDGVYPLSVRDSALWIGRSGTEAGKRFRKVMLDVAEDVAIAEETKEEATS